MKGWETCLLLAAVPVGLVAAGYWLVSELRAISPAERLAAAMLAGLGALLWTVSVVNLALPLGGIWGWACVLPLVAPLGRATTRRRLAEDITVAFCNRRGLAMLGATGVFLGALLWPLFSRSDVLFYDGSGGHDAFFWIVGAEHLKRQSYLQPAVTNPAYPLFYSIESIVGLRPVWGRMGAEGLLALISNLVGASPLKLYVAATAALFFPWVAAVFLVARTFLVERTTTAGAVALVLLQPVFIFYQANANLPNLLGILAGALTVVACARATGGQGTVGRRWWLLLVALGTHGVMCAYPELIPAIALSVGLLAGRAWLASGDRADRVRVAALVGAVALGALLNPVTTLRAGSGMVASMSVAASSRDEAHIFEGLAPAAAPPAMLTLSPRLGRKLDTAGGVVACALIVVAGTLAIRRARDRFGAVAMLAGGAAILIYTGVTGFAYGWQKTVQFSGVFLAALLPFGVLGRGREIETPPAWARWPGAVVVAGAAALFALATVANFAEVHKWANRKFLTWDWFGARAFSRQELRNVPVLVDAHTFQRPFFYTMWAAYFLDESRVLFAAEKVGGGYLRPSLEKYPPDWVQAPQAMVVAGDTSVDDPLRTVWKSDAVAIVVRAPR